MGAEQGAVEPAGVPVPVHDQVQLIPLLPLTTVGIPVAHKFVEGAEALGTPLAVPQVPFTVQGRLGAAGGAGAGDGIGIGLSSPTAAGTAGTGVMEGHIGLLFPDVPAGVAAVPGDTLILPVPVRDAPAVALTRLNAGSLTINSSSSSFKLSRVTKATTLQVLNAEAMGRNTTLVIGVPEGIRAPAASRQLDGSATYTCPKTSVRVALAADIVPESKLSPLPLLSGIVNGANVKGPTLAFVPLPGLASIEISAVTLPNAFTRLLTVTVKGYLEYAKGLFPPAVTVWAA